MSRSFNGSSDYVDFGSSSNGISGLGDLTWAIWAQSATAADTNYHSWFSQGLGRGGTGDDAFNIEAYASSDASFPSKVVVNIKAGGTTNAVALATIDTALHHVAGVWTVSNKGLQGYLDGLLKSSNTFAVARTNPATSVLVGCGHNSSGTRTEFANLTSASWASIWSAALEAEEILLLAAGAHPLSIRPQSLVFCAPIDGASSPEPDIIGLKFGTVNGTGYASSAPLIKPLSLEWYDRTINVPAGGGFTAKFRRTLSPIGSRVGSRQTHGWGA